MSDKRKEIQSLLSQIGKQSQMKLDATERVDAALRSMSTFVQLATVAPDAAFSLDFLVNAWIRCFSIETKTSAEKASVQEFLNWSKMKAKK